MRRSPAYARPATTHSAGRTHWHSCSTRPRRPRTGASCSTASRATSCVPFPAVSRRPFCSPELFLLPAGSRTLSQLEILGSPGFSALLKHLDGHFDVIIFDTPPCMAVSDAYVVTAQADAVMFVVKSGSSGVQAARSVLRRLRALNVDIAGAVLNQVDMSASRYTSGIGDYYTYRQYTERPDAEGGRIEEPAAPATS